MTVDAAQREWEQRLKLPAAMSAGLGGLLILVGGFLPSTLNEGPQVGVLQALTPAIGGEVEAAVSPQIEILAYEQEQFGTLLAGAAFTAIGLICMGIALLYLYRRVAIGRGTV